MAQPGIRTADRAGVGQRASAAGAHPTLTISFLRGDTADPHCVAYPDRFYAQFTAPGARDPRIGRYEAGCSILVTPPTFDAYWSSPHAYWMRQRVRRAGRDGFAFAPIERDDYLDDIYAINTSLPERQGRPMAEAYRQRPAPQGPLPAFPCPRHALRRYGVLREGHLYAYAWVYVIGEMCLFSTILGHGEQMRSGIMALLVAEAVRDLMASAGLRYAMYNLHASGTDGLRFFKEQMGFAPYDVRWVMGDGSDEARQAARALAAEAALRAGGQGSASGRQRTGAPALQRIARRVGRLFPRG
ncbi:MAG: hypothetical protein ACP5VP_07080 [Candidatus Limnocylindrales bacterium]